MKRFVPVVLAIVVALSFPAVVAYADTLSNALDAKKAAEEVATIQNAYQDIDVLTQTEELQANADKMDKYLASDALDERVPWYQTYGTWVYSGILQDNSGNPCIMWVCRENPNDTSSVVYAFATATYIPSSSGDGYFTAVKHRPTSQGVAALPTTANENEVAAAQETETVIGMVDEIREYIGDQPPVDAEGLEAAAQARNQYRYEQTRDPEYHDTEETSE